MMKEEINWYVGQEVAHFYKVELVDIVKVERVDDLLIAGDRYYGTDGREIGWDNYWWNCHRIVPATEELKQQVIKNKLINDIRNSNFKDLSIEILKSLKSTIDENKIKGVD